MKNDDGTFRWDIEYSDQKPTKSLRMSRTPEELNTNTKNQKWVNEILNFIITPTMLASLAENIMTFLAKSYLW